MSSSDEDEFQTPRAPRSINLSKESGPNPRIPLDPRAQRIANRQRVIELVRFESELAREAREEEARIMADNLAVIAQLQGQVQTLRESLSN